MEKISLLIIVMFAFTQSYANDPGAVVRAIQDRDNVSCNWVDNVGDTTAAEKVKLVEMGPGCKIEGNDGNDRRASALCNGTIRCAGLGSGWGDIYFEDVHCPGANQFGKAVCGRSGDSNARGRSFSEGIKSCLVSFITNDGTVVPSGSNQIIRQSPKSLEVSQ